MNKTSFRSEKTKYNAILRNSESKNGNWSVYMPKEIIDTFCLENKQKFDIYLDKVKRAIVFRIKEKDILPYSVWIDKLSKKAKPNKTSKSSIKTPAKILLERDIHMLKQGIKKHKRKLKNKNLSPEYRKIMEKRVNKEFPDIIKEKEKLLKDLF
jgi:hypothetical protein